MQKEIVTIDGSSYTGKTTVTRALAKLLGYTYLNSGSLFKTIGYYALKKNLQPENVSEIVNIAKSLNMEFRNIDEKSILFVNGEEMSSQLVPQEVVTMTSKIASIPEVREELLRIQRDIASEGAYVIEGRDAGSVVFPNAKWKFFLEASLEIKVKRFFRQMPPEEKVKYTTEEVRKIISKIDRCDITREIAPLKKADDAIVYDNSDSPNAEQDAVVLWYYITHHKEIIKNSEIMKQ